MKLKFDWIVMRTKSNQGKIGKKVKKQNKYVKCTYACVCFLF